MKVQMRSNDIFFGLTFDAPFFAFLHQSIFLILKETYPDLELGYYFHFTDNIHFYERHYDLVESIKENGTGEEYSLILKHKMIDYKNGSVFLTDKGKEFLQSVDNTITRETTQHDYKSILSDYFKLTK